MKIGRIIWFITLGVLLVGCGKAEDTAVKENTTAALTVVYEEFESEEALDDYVKNNETIALTIPADAVSCVADTNPIQIINIKDYQTVEQLREHLKERGYGESYILYPTTKGK